MNKIYVVFLFLSILCNAQNNCRDTLINFKFLPFTRYGVEDCYSYLELNYSLSKCFYSCRKELTPFEISHNSGSKLVLENNGLFVEINFKNQKIQNDFFYPKGPSQKYSVNREYNQGDPFGVTSEDSIVEVMYEIYINSVPINSNYFSDLCNPNRFETILGIDPISAALSETKEYIYLYIFGELDLDLMPLNHAIDFSYMAKLIFTINGDFVERIVVPGSILKYFGLGQSPYFNGF